MVNIKNTEKEVALEVKNVSKIFPGTKALDSVNVEFYRQEIHAILGENGAGKSTLCKILTGAYHPTEGEVVVFGKKADFKTTSDSISEGIGMIYQERNVIGHLTGAQNIALGYEPKKGLFVDEKKIKEVSDKISDMIGAEVPLDVPVNTLGAGEQQLIEIMRAFYNDPKFLILDEPTASLGEKEVEPFLKFVRKIVDTTGITVIFISHKIEEVYAITDRITVMTDGKKVLTKNVEDLPQDECLRTMLRQKDMAEIKHKECVKYDEAPMLDVGSLKYDGKEHRLNIKVHKGEAVGFYGLVGSGRTEFAEAIFGKRKMENSSFVFNGETIKKPLPEKMIQKGFIMTPEKRSDAVFPSFSLTENIGGLYWKRHAAKVIGTINYGEVKKFAKGLLERHNVKYANQSQRISGLSGGNIQKIILGRSVEVPGINMLIFDEPTQGIDIGAKFEIYQKIRAFVEDGEKSAIFISSELDELITVCDRIYIFAEGSVSGEFSKTELDKTKLLEAAIRRNKNAG